MMLDAATAQSSQTLTSNGTRLELYHALLNWGEASSFAVGTEVKTEK